MSGESLAELEAWVEKLRCDRIRLERQIAELYREQNRFYGELIKPNSATAGLYKAAIRKGDQPLTLKEAELLDKTTPTGAFEYGRAQLAHVSTRIRSLRTKEQKVAAELEKARSELRRRRPDLPARVRQLRPRTLALLGRI